jgi:hypothetical protein
MQTPTISTRPITGHRKGHVNLGTPGADPKILSLQLIICVPHTFFFCEAYSFLTYARDGQSNVDQGLGESSPAPRLTQLRGQRVDE